MEAVITLRRCTYSQTHHCASPPSLSPWGVLSPPSSLAWGGVGVGAGAGATATGGGGSGTVSMATGNISAGGTVATGELHSAFEPLRRASRCLFLYSSKDTWEM